MRRAAVRYARDGGVTLANLMEHLPLSNDPGCARASHTASSRAWRPT